MLSPRRAFCALIVLASISLGACGGSHAIVPPSNGFTPTTDSISALSNFVETTVPNVAGTYSGSVVATESGKSESGTVVIVLQQSGSAISGSVKTTINGKTATFSLSGTVKRTVKGAFLKFTIFNPNGRNASATATVIGSHLNGKAYVPPSGTKPAITFKIRTVKQ